MNNILNLTGKRKRNPIGLINKVAGILGISKNAVYNRIRNGDKETIDIYEKALKEYEQEIQQNKERYENLKNSIPLNRNGS